MEFGWKYVWKSVEVIVVKYVWCFCFLILSTVIVTIVVGWPSLGRDLMRSCSHILVCFFYCDRIWIVVALIGSWMYNRWLTCMLVFDVYCDGIFVWRWDVVLFWFLMISFSWYNVMLGLSPVIMLGSCSWLDLTWILNWTMIVDFGLNFHGCCRHSAH